VQALVSNVPDAARSRILCTNVSSSRRLLVPARKQKEIDFGDVVPNTVSAR
jgi:hypothetical protein